MKREKAIDIFEDNFTVLNTHDHYSQEEEVEAKETAIRSLEAWDEVLKEIIEYGAIWVSYRIKGKTEKDIEKIVSGVLNQAKEQIIDIIKKHLQEIEE